MGTKWHSEHHLGSTEEDGKMPLKVKDHVDHEVLDFEKLKFIIRIDPNLCELAREKPETLKRLKWPRI